MANLSDRIAELASLETKLAEEKDKENPNMARVRKLERQLTKAENDATNEHEVENPMSGGF
jgi:hypothetical protein